MDRDARVQELLYSCDSREELCERVARMEEADFVRLHRIDMEWPAGEGVEKYTPLAL